MLVLSGVELAFFTVACMGLCFRFLLNTGLITDAFVIAEQLIIYEGKEATAGTRLLVRNTGIKHYCTKVKEFSNIFPHCCIDDFFKKM